MIEITEKQWEQQIHDLAHTFHWKYHHTWTSIHSPRGFPDDVMCRGERLIFAELKTTKGKLTPYQSAWIEALTETKAEVYVWRPSDFNNIVEIMR